jgi:flagellar hook-associated protein 3 FlgL
MFPSLSPQTNIFLNGLSQLQTTINNATSQLTSGYRITQPADAPDQISPLLQLQANLSHNQAISNNLTSVQASVNGADQAVSSGIQLLNQALSLASEGAGSTVTAATRASLAQQVQTIQQQMVNLANTQVARQYVFSGDLSNQPSYALDLSQPPTVPQNGVDRLITPASTGTVELADSTFIPVSQTAETLFDHRDADDSLASDNVFAALNSLQVALTNNDTAGISAAQDSLHTAYNYLNSKETFYGTTLDQVTASVNQISSENVNLQQQISTIRDANVAQTALTLTSAESENQAALAAEGRFPNTSLFNFLG